MRTNGQVLRDLILSTPLKTGRNKGAAKYIRCPEWIIYEKLGERVLEADFVGERLITGQSAPIHIPGYTFKKKPRLRHFMRVKGETTDEFIRCSAWFFEQFEKHGVVKVELKLPSANAITMIGSFRGKRTLSRIMMFLLRQQLYPMFAVPRQPFSQASMEGSNSVFGHTVNKN